MVESLLKKSDLAAAAKGKIIIARIYFVLTLLVVFITIVAAFAIVRSNSSETVEIAEYVNVNRDFAKAIKSLNQELDRIKLEPAPYDLTVFLPDSEGLTDLTRKFDQLFASWNQPNSPMKNQNLSFGQVIVDEEKGVSALPVTLNLTSSLDNFKRFLTTIEQSGLPGSDLRLMDIQSVSINLASTESKNGVKTIGYTVNLNAYFSL